MDENNRGHESNGSLRALSLFASVKGIPMNVYRTGPYVQLLDIDEHTTLVGHPFFLTFSVLESDVANILKALRDRASTIEELQQRLAVPLKLIEQAIDFLRAQHFVLADNDRE